MAEEKCLCDQCPRRFVCFTQKKVFSDPAYQAMYEAYIEEGLEHVEAVKRVREFIEKQKTPIVGDLEKPREGKQNYNEWWEHGYKKPSYWGVSGMPVDEAKEVIDNIKYETKELMKKYGKSTKSEM